MLKIACIKKQGNQKFTLKPLPSSPPFQGDKQSSQLSSELSSLEECLVAEKGRENGRKGEKRENWSPIIYSLEKKSPITVYTNGLYSH